MTQPAAWPLLPLALRLEGSACLVVGDTDQAERKCELLTKAGALIQRMSPAQFQQSLADGTLCKTLAGAMLVVSATGDTTVDEAVATEAQALGIFVNVAENRLLSSAIFPSIVDRSPLLIAVSSGGEAPVLTRLIRNRLEAFLPSRLGHLAQLASALRETVKSKLTNINQRRRYWETVLEGQVPDLVYSGAEDKARDRMLEVLDTADDLSSAGEVYLVGAGPGDPDLLTFRALRLMRQADVVLYDRLVSPQILDLVRRDAERIDVGKARSQHTVPQEEINEMLARLALEGKRVLRLKGGDPFIFGRGGEEIDLLASKGVPFQVVPGITAASGCAAYSGIPLTHRDHSQSVRFITAHLKNNTSDLPWFELVRPRQTLVFYMGLAALPLIARELVAHGMAADMPAAIVSKGTLPEQRVLTSTISELAALVAAEEVPGPTIIIVGTVVRLRDQLAWQTVAHDAAS
ncbi:siroheme synthase CysG [Allohahella marinimesophila]|uniref:Siroheme synthase n=1 Tax=Allohahella marinimesophila TaxID=1054972 RepID=A0ABP7NVQ5_9GAMM